MSSKETNSKKKLKAKTQSSNIKEITIEYLNEDCLLEIFKYLSNTEKIELESVCKTWNRIIKRSWSHINSLKLNQILPYRFNTDHNSAIKRKNTKYLMNILKRCGSYLNNIRITYSHINCLLSSRILNEIPKYCNNVTCLSLLDDNVYSLFTDENLKVLFKNNMNIFSITLKNIDIYGDCFSELNINNIKDLQLINCTFESDGQFYGFLSNLKNLKTFYLNNNIENINQVLHALIVGKCEKISDINIKVLDLNNKSGELKNLSLFVSKQSNLCKLKLYNLFVDEFFLDKLPRDSLEILILHFPKNFHSDFVLNISLFLSNHKNIQKFELFNVPYSYELSDDQLKNCQVSDFVELSVGFDEIEEIEFVENQMNLPLFLSKHPNIRKLNLFNVLIKDKSMDELTSELTYTSKATLFLEELSIYYTDIDSQYFAFLHSVQDIEKRIFNSIELNETLIRSLPFESLTKLDLDLSGNQNCDLLIKCFDRFLNLQNLKLLFKELFNDYLLSIIKFINKNINKIEINFLVYYPPEKPIGRFSRLRKLNSFVFRCLKGNKPKIDYLLKDLSTCKNLNYLSIDYCIFSSLALSRLSNLIEFEAKYTTRNDDDMVEFMKNVKNLQEIRFENCNYLTNDLIKKISDIKIERGDTEDLNIIFIDKCESIDLNELKNLPLVNVYYYQ